MFKIEDTARFSYPVVICDECGKRIENCGLANVLIYDDGSIRVAHKSCDDGKTALRWTPLDFFLVRLCHNVQVDIPATLKEIRSIGGMI